MSDEDLPSAFTAGAVNGAEGGKPYAALVRSASAEEFSTLSGSDIITSPSPCVSPFC